MTEQAEVIATTDVAPDLPVHASHEVHVPSVFGNKDAFEHSQRVARMLGESALVPKDYQKNIPNCMIALEMATRMGASPLMVMQNLYIVHGRPAWSSQFLIATLNATNKFTPIRYEEDDLEGGRCRAYANDKSTGETLYGVWVSMEMANAEGWINKNGSKWKTMPQLMRRYRAAAFFTRQFAPEVSMGIMTAEEVTDVEVISSTPVAPEPVAVKIEEKMAKLKKPKQSDIDSSISLLEKELETLEDPSSDTFLFKSAELDELKAQRDGGK